MRYFRKFTPHEWAMAIKALAFVGGFFAIYSLVSIQTQGKVTADQTKLIAEQAKTIAEQNKALAEQGNKIAVESQAHIDCIAELFARHTRDDKPITITDLTTCQTRANAAVNTTPTEPEAETPNMTIPPSAPEPQDPDPNRPEDPHPPIDNRNMLQKVLDDITSRLPKLF